MTGVSESEAQTIVASLAEQGVRTVVIGGCDTHGVMRGKRIPLEFLASALTHGLPLCDVFWVMHVDESELVPRPAGHTGYFPTEQQGYPDIVAIPDATTLRRVPWHEATAAFLVDWHRPHGEGPVPIDPRGVLRRVVERAYAMGFTPMDAALGCSLKTGLSSNMTFTRSGSRDTCADMFCPTSPRVRPAQGALRRTSR